MTKELEKEEFYHSELRDEYQEERELHTECRNELEEAKEKILKLENRTSEGIIDHERMAQRLNEKTDRIHELEQLLKNEKVNQQNYKNLIKGRDELVERNTTLYKTLQTAKSTRDAYGLANNELQCLNHELAKDLRKMTTQRNIFRTKWRNLRRERA